MALSSIIVMTSDDRIQNSNAFSSTGITQITQWKVPGSNPVLNIFIEYKTFTETKYKLGNIAKVSNGNNR